MSKKRIAWAIEWNNPNPNYWFTKEDSFQDALVRLSDEYEVFVVTLHPNRTDDAVYKEVNYLFCKDAGQIVEKLKAVQPDIINYWGFDRPVSRMADSAFPDVPKTVYPVGSQQLSERDFPYCSRVFVTTKEQKQLISHKTMYPRRQIVVCPFTATGVFGPKETYGDERYDVVYITDWRRMKRQHLLIEALDKIEFSRIAFIGGIHDQTYFNEHRKKIKQTYNRGFVELIDRVPAFAVPSYLRESKVAVQLSESEGGSRVVTEVMACGVPLIVCDDCDSNRQRVENNKTGYVIKPTPDALAKKINKLLRSEKIREKVGRAAAEAMNVQREKASMYRIFRKAFRQILAEKALEEDEE